MAKESSLVLKICDKIAKYSIYAAIFLTPVLFLPWTADVLDFNKQAILLVLVMVALFAWMLKVLVSGKFELNLNWTHAVVGVLFLVCLLSTVFSLYGYGSFWGWPQITSESLLTLLAFVLLYFVASNILSKKDIFTSAIILSFSVLLAEIIGILQLFGVININTIGSAGGLGFFAAITLPLAMALLIVAKKWWKALFIVEIFLSATILFLINYPIVWWAVIAGSAIFLIFGTIKREIIDGRWMALPIFFLAVALFFVLLNPQINLLSQRANEIFLSQSANIGIDFGAIKERPILGSGPGTFAYDFSKFKNSDFNKSSLWNISFNQGSSKVLNDLATTGILGFLALLAFIFFPIFYGVKFLIKEKEVAGTEKENNKNYYILILGFTVSLAVSGLAYFLYSSNFVLDFVYFFLIAGSVALLAKNKKQFELKPSSITTLVVTFVFTLVFIFGLGILILDGQRYVADINYSAGLAKLQAGNTDAGMQGLEVAASQNPASDLYFRQLAQVYLIKLQGEIQSAKGSPTDAQTKDIQALIQNSINASKIATDLNPTSVDDWSIRGYIYQNMFDLVNDAGKWANSSYDSALKISPNNPYILSQEGNVNLGMALRLAADQTQQKNQLLTQAQSQLENATNSVPNYSDALYSLGLVYDALGQTSKSIATFTKVQQLNPTDKTIPQILANLNAGKPILQSATPPTQTPPGSATTNSTTETTTGTSATGTTKTSPTKTK